MLVSTSEEIAKSQLNRSKSKAQYSFSRANRFPSLQPHDNPNICYNFESSLDKRAADIGRGNKFDFTKAQLNTPAPNQYSTQSGLDATRPKSSAFTFGLSRDKCTKRYVEGHFQSDPSVPGPGTYTMQTIVGSGGAKYSIRPKTTTFDQIFNCKDVPGPGSYKSSLETSLGKSVLSTLKSSPIPVISHKSYARFPNQKDEIVPGPGAYQTTQGFLNGLPLSQYKYAGARKFTCSQREFFGKKDLDTPGPGSYRLPSEFGYYENRKKNPSVPEFTARKKKL